MSVPSAPNIWVRPLGTLNQLEFWWREPESGTPITYYQLACSSASILQNFSSNVFQTRISSLSNSQEYQFTLAAANAYGLGQPSSFSSVQPGDKPKSNFISEFSMLSPSTATLSWNFTQSQNEGLAKWFVVTAIASTSQSTLSFSATSAAASTIITNLTEDTYQIQAFAVNDSGWQYADRTEILKVDAQIYAVAPVAASNVEISEISTTAASITWTPGAYHNYQAFYINNTLAHPATVNTTKATFTDLMPATTYILTINSQNTVGSTASNPIVILTNTVLPTPITDLTQTQVSLNQMIVKWSGGIGTTNYSFSLNGITVQPFSVNLEFNTVQFNGLNPNSVYAVKITASNLGGTVVSNPGIFITLPLPPSQPTNLQSPYIDNKGFSLSFIGGNSPENIVTSYVFTLNGLRIRPSTFVYYPSSAIYSTMFSTYNTVNSTYSSLVSLFSSTISISSLFSSVAGSTLSTYIEKTGDEKVVQFNNLSSATAYQLIVQASNSGGNISSQSTWVSTLATLPTTPIIVSSSSATPTEITIVWTGGTYATSYTFTLNNIVTTPTYILPGKTATFSNLQSSDTYSIVAVATNISGSAYSNPYQASTPIAYPSQPVQLVTSAVTPSGFTLSWTGGISATSYTFLVNGLQSTPASYSTANKNVTFTGLLDSTTYNIIVIAVNESGTNESNTQAVTTLIAIPTKPINLVSSAIDYRSFIISWTGGDIASSFSFTLNGTTTQPIAYSLSEKTAKFSNLNASTAYAVIVIAINSTGQISSSPYTVTTTIAPPDYPLSVTASAVAYNTISIYWTNSDRATSFSYTVNGIATVPATTGELSATFNSLIAYNNYTFVVTGINTSGSTSSAPYLVRTWLAPPSQPQSITANTFTQTSFSIAWTMPNQIPLIPTSNMATDFFFTLNGLSVTPTSYSISGFTANFSNLVAGTSYAVIVISNNQSGTNPSAAVTFVTVPSNPTGLKLVTATSTTLSISWSDGDGATSYTFTLNGTPTTPTAVSVNDKTATFSGLTEQTSYSIIVTAINSSGSAPSAGTSFSTLVAAPSAPINVTASSITSSEFTLSWSGADTATSYTFTFDGSPKAATTVSVGGKTATFTGLDPSTTYSVVVNASNVSGTASSTPVSVATTGGGGGVVLQVITRTRISNSGYGIVFDSAGENFYTCFYNPPQVIKVTYPGFSESTYCTISGAKNLIGLTMDAAGVLYVTDNANLKMYKITGQNSSSFFASGPCQSCVVGIDGYMYAATRSSVLRISNTGSVTTISTGGYQSLTGAKMGPDGNVYVLDSNGFIIYKMNSDGSNKTSFATVPFAWDMCFDTAGNMYVGCVSTNNYIVVIKPDGSKINYAGTGYAGSSDGALLSATMSLNGITIGPDGNIWFTNSGNSIRIAQEATPLNAMPLNAFTNSPPTAPSQPNNLASSNPTPTGFTIKWQNGDPATSVTFTLSGTAKTPKTLILGGKIATFSGLSSGATYDVVVTATNVAGSTSSAPFPASTLQGPPSQPSSLSTSDATATGFTLSWLDGAPATSYTFTLNGTATTPSTQSVSGKTATFTGLTAGTTYSVIVTAVNSSGSTASNPYGVPLGAPPTVPKNITGSAISGSGFTMNWTGGNGATSYIFKLNDTVTTASSQSVSGKTATFTGLIPSTGYSIIIDAINSYGTTSSKSGLGGFTPKKVSGITHWYDGLDPLDTGVSPSANTSIGTWKDKSGNSYHAVQTNGSAQATYVNNGGLQFSFDNKREYNIASSPTLNTATFFFVISPAPIPASGISVCSYVYWSSNTNQLLTSWDGKAFVQWNYGPGIIPIENVFVAGLSAPQINLIDWTLTANTSSIGYYNGSEKFNKAVGSTYATRLLKLGNSDLLDYYGGIMYEIIVYNGAISLSDRQEVQGYLAWKWGVQNTLPANHPFFAEPPGTAGTTIFTTNAPGPPTNIVASSITQSGFQLGWDGASGATSYSFTFNGTSRTPLSSSVPNKTATFAGLTAGTYAVIITAVSSNGSTPSSSTDISTKPGAITNLASSAITTTGFTISWSGGVGSTSYSYTSNGTNATPSTNNGVASKTASFTGLTGGTTYSIVVNAINSSGTTSSSSLNVTTTAAAQPPTKPVLTSSAITSSGFTVSWTGGTGATSFTYTLNGTATTPASATGSSATFTGLTGGTSYAVIVTAVNVGGSTSSSSLSVSTSAAGPVSPTAVSFTSKYTWDAIGYISGNNLGGLVFDQAGNNLYLFDYGIGIIRKVVYPSGSSSVYYSSSAYDFTQIPHMAIDSNNTIITGYNNLYKIPQSLAVSSSSLGNPIFAYTLHSNGYLYGGGNGSVYRVSASGVVTPITPTFIDGSAITTFTNVYTIMIDSSDNMYAVDCQNNRVVRMSLTGANAITFAGNPAGTYGLNDGTGTAAGFSSPTRACMDSNGFIYLMERGNAVIRCISPTGVVTTLVSSSGPLTLTVSLNSLCIGPDGNLWIAEYRSKTVGTITMSPPLTRQPYYAFTGA